MQPFDTDRQEQLCPTQMAKPKVMSLLKPGPHIGWHIYEGRTFNDSLELSKVNVFES